jgi:hypothetical protein
LGKNKSGWCATNHGEENKSVWCATNHGVKVFGVPPTTGKEIWVENKSVWCATNAI